jgi:hypothetical protein
MASGMIAFFHIAGTRNPPDMLSKHWAYGDVWKMMQPLLFWKGDTAGIDAVGAPA